MSAIRKRLQLPLLADSSSSWAATERPLTRVLLPLAQPGSKERTGRSRPVAHNWDRSLLAASSLVAKLGGARTLTGYPAQLTCDVVRNLNAVTALATQLESILSGDPKGMEPIRRFHTAFADCLPLPGLGGE
jgi:hypothetical protein